MDKFLKCYGTQGLGLLVKKFITEAPTFPDDNKLAKEIGYAIGLLEIGLEELTDKAKRRMLKS